MIQLETLQYLFHENRHGAAVLPAGSNPSRELGALMIRCGLETNADPVRLAALCGGVLAADGCVLVFGGGSKDCVSLMDMNPPGVEKAKILVIAADNSGGLFALDRTDEAQESRILYLDAHNLEWRIIGRYTQYNDFLWWLANRSGDNYEDLVYGHGQRLPRLSAQSLQGISARVRGKIEVWLNIWQQHNGGEGGE